MNADPYRPPVEASPTIQKHSAIQRLAIGLFGLGSAANIFLTAYVFSLAKSRVSPGQWRQENDILLVVIYVACAIGFVIAAMLVRYGFFYTGVLLALLVLVVTVAGPFIFDPSWEPARSLFR